jgi:hypothetical protein
MVTLMQGCPRVRRAPSASCSRPPYRYDRQAFGAASLGMEWREIEDKDACGQSDGQAAIHCG